MDGFGQTTLENLSLQPSLQKIFDLEGRHVIETHAGLVQHTDAHETEDEGVTLEERRLGPLWSSLRSSRAARRILERMRVIR